MHAWHTQTRIAHRAALTLLELVVVLAILAILAGVLVAKPDILNRANNTAWMTNLVELDKAIGGYAAVHYGAYPDGMDSLVDAGGNLYAGVPGGRDGPLATYLEAKTITSQQVNRLNRVGITTVQIMKTDPTTGFGATYFPYSDGAPAYRNPQSLSSDSKLVFLRKPDGSTYLYRPNKIYLDDTHDYVLLGVGQACALMQATGGWSKDCPVLRHQEGCLDPATAYCRVAIFDLGAVASGGGQDKFAAKFVGTVCLGNQSLKFSTEMATIPERLE